MLIKIIVFTLRMIIIKGKIKGINPKINIEFFEHKIK